MGSGQATHRALIEMHHQFGTNEVLGPEPTVLSVNHENAQAYAHSVHLATFEHPLAFGSGYRSFSVSGAKSFFLHPAVTTFAIGEAHALQAGVSVIHQTPDVGAWGSYCSEPTESSIEFLFKHRSLKSLDIGRMLGTSALTYLAERGASSVSVSVTSNNKVMHSVYARMGFCEFGASGGNGFKIIHMKLFGKEAIVELSNKLKS